jgi:hypothetical protein
VIVSEEEEGEDVEEESAEDDDVDDDDLRRGGGETTGGGAKDKTRDPDRADAKIARWKRMVLVLVWSDVGSRALRPPRLVV